MFPRYYTIILNIQTDSYFSSLCDLENCPSCYYHIYPRRSPGIYFLYMIFNPVFLWALSAFYIGVYIYFRALNPCVYLSPGVYMSPAFIQINMVYFWWYQYTNMCTNSHSLQRTQWYRWPPYWWRQSPPHQVVSSSSSPEDYLLWRARLPTPAHIRVCQNRTPQSESMLVSVQSVNTKILRMYMWRQSMSNVS